MTHEELKNEFYLALRNRFNHTTRPYEDIAGWALNDFIAEHIANKLRQYGVMQAEASGSAEGSAVASSAVGKGVSDGHDETHVTIRDGEFEWCMACSRQIKRAEH